MSPHSGDPVPQSGNTTLQQEEQNPPPLQRQPSDLPQDSLDDESSLSETSQKQDPAGHVCKENEVKPEEPEYEIPMSSNDEITPDDSRSPIYSTVTKPSHLKLEYSTCGSSVSTYARPGTPLNDVTPGSGVMSYDLTPGTGVVSYASTMILPATPVSDYPMNSLDWLPRVPKKQRCVQVSVMEEDLRTTRREMLFCDVGQVSETNRDLTLMTCSGDTIYRTCYDVGTGAYGIILDNERMLKRNSERLIGNSRVVGCLFKLESTKTRDVWELRDPQSGKTNALIKIRKWNGFVHGCVHVNRGTEGVVKKADIKIRRVRGSSDVIVAAVLNDQIITTIRRGAGRETSVDNNIFALFVAPYIDSVAVVSVFTCIAHIQLRYERPRTTSNIIGMLLAKEARYSGRQLSASVVKAKTVVSKTTVELSDTIANAFKESDRADIKFFPKMKTIKIGTFPVRVPSTPTGITRTFSSPHISTPTTTTTPADTIRCFPKRGESNRVAAENRAPGTKKKLYVYISPTGKSPTGKRMTLAEFKKKHANVKKHSESEKEKKMKDQSVNAKSFIVNALKGTERELSKFGKQAETGFKKVSAKTSENISRLMEKRSFFGGLSRPTQNAETT